MKNFIFLFMFFLVLSSCNSDIDDKKEDITADPSIASVVIENKNLVNIIDMFCKEEMIKKNGFGVITLRIYNDETLRKFYGLSVLNNDNEFTAFKPVCYAVLDTNIILIKIDAIKTLFKPLSLDKFNTKKIEKTKNKNISSRHSFWMLEEINDSILILEKRMN